MLQENVKICFVHEAPWAVHASKLSTWYTLPSTHLAREEIHPVDANQLEDLEQISLRQNNKMASFIRFWCIMKRDNTIIKMVQTCISTMISTHWDSLTHTPHLTITPERSTAHRPSIRRNNRNRPDWHVPGGKVGDLNEKSWEWSGKMM